MLCYNFKSLISRYDGVDANTIINTNVSIAIRVRLHRCGRTDLVWVQDLEPLSAINCTCRTGRERCVHRTLSVHDTATITRITSLAWNDIEPCEFPLSCSIAIGNSVKLKYSKRSAVVVLTAISNQAALILCLVLTDIFIGISNTWDTLDLRPYNCRVTRENMRELTMDWC